MNRIVVLALIALANPVAAQSRRPYADSGDFRWHGALRAGQIIEVKTVIGDVRAEPTSGKEVEVVGVKRWKHSDPESVHIDVLNHEDGVTICAVWPIPRWGRRRERLVNVCVPGDTGSTSVDDNDVEVDFTVKVPKGVNVVLRSVTGEVVALGIDGDVDAESVSGRVEARATGSVEAASVSGNLRVAMGSTKWDGAIDLRSLSGTIDVELPPSADVNVHTRTTYGSVRSDFPLQTTGRAIRRADATLGKGGRDLYVTSFSGTVRLRTASR